MSEWHFFIICLVLLYEDIVGFLINKRRILKSFSFKKIVESSHLTFVFIFIVKSIKFRYKFQREPCLKSFKLENLDFGQNQKHPKHAAD